MTKKPAIKKGAMGKKATMLYRSVAMQEQIEKIAAELRQVDPRVARVVAEIRRKEELRNEQVEKIAAEINDRQVGA